ncbi:hypothetical protein F383_12624 [Gossypium arboreum]|uniref:Uncharacterized protein n=1 Tax=Gossypium arboreum TaxID=29729 RepID=A0A0B0M7G1_GOSAR|nr:hypothetical protein F383_37229 [Gossypium arboreum]KHG28292.1 hypothetical protein F383_12624 [Gossypium arboreum]
MLHCNFRKPRFAVFDLLHWNFRETGSVGFANVTTCLLKT